MRIALLHYTCAPVVGGVERVMAEHAALFRAAGHEVTVLCGEGEACLRPVLEKQELVVLHNVLTMPFRPALTRALWDLAESLTGVRFLHWIHDLAAIDPAYTAMIAAASEPELFSRAHPRVEYVAVSEWRRQQWRAVSGSDCRVIPNGIDVYGQLRLGRLRAMAERWRLLEREAVFFHPARLLRRKNLEWSLGAVAAARAAGHDAVLLLTAAPNPHGPADPYLEELRALIAEQAHVVCCVSAELDASPADDDLLALYALADALLLPSRHEGFGLPLLEAALHRLPIFCSEIEPLRSLLPAGSVTAFSLTEPSGAVAAEMMRQIAASRPIQNRKAVVRAYAWPVVFRKCLAPLLAGD